MYRNRKHAEAQLASMRKKLAKLEDKDPMDVGRRMALEKAIRDLAALIKKRWPE